MDQAFKYASDLTGSHTNSHSQVVGLISESSICKGLTCNITNFSGHAVDDRKNLHIQRNYGQYDETELSGLVFQNYDSKVHENSMGGNIAGSEYHHAGSMSTDPMASSSVTAMAASTLHGAAAPPPPLTSPEAGLLKPKVRHIGHLDGSNHKQMDPALGSHDYANSGSMATQVGSHDYGSHPSGSGIPIGHGIPTGSGMHGTPTGSGIPIGHGTPTGSGMHGTPTGYGMHDNHIDNIEPFNVSAGANPLPSVNHVHDDNFIPEPLGMGTSGNYNGGR